ncbi:MAG: carbamoyltransferase [Thermoleophilia bacterium]|nr:carbamoyltransferase [Thermoleophilia bacterium]
MRDGQLVACVEEERFTRQKHTGDFPAAAIRHCVREAGITAGELDNVCYYWNPLLSLPRQAWYIARNMPRSLQLVRSRQNRYFPMFRVKQRVWRELGLTRADKAKFHFINHHLAHAASAFYPSPFDDAAILTLDAAGEWTTTWLGRGRGTELKAIREISFPHSLGMLYGAVTEHLGFKFSSGEGKVMGLASYGKPDLVDEFRKLVDIDEESGDFRLDLSYFDWHVKGRGKWVSDKFRRIFGPEREPESGIEERHANIAYALQAVTEEAGLSLARYLHRVTGAENICLAGGVALNAVMNGRILDEGPFKRVFIQPAANDPGTSVGACLLMHVKNGGGRDFRMEHAYWGPSYSNEDIERELKASGVTYNRVEDAPAEAARLLAADRIVAWFQGRMECGPRALGNRSILSDPRTADKKDILNARVKHRESFRPFAPSVLEEKVRECFDSDHPSPYMILVYNVLPDRKHELEAITHVDGTARVQTVSRRVNERYYRLIEEFERLTGVPVVLNTSFNVRGQPIVNTPAEAVECYLGTGIDALVIGDFVTVKEPEPGAVGGPGGGRQ